MTTSRRNVRKRTYRVCDVSGRVRRYWLTASETPKGDFPPFKDDGTAKLRKHEEAQYFRGLISQNTVNHTAAGGVQSTVIQ